MEVRQDDYLYIVSSVGLTLNSNSIELKGPTSINGVTTINGATQFNGAISVRDGMFILDPIDMNRKKIINLGTPTADTDAATKKYVDDAIAAALRPYRKES